MKWEAETSTQEAIAALRQVALVLNSFAPTTTVSSLCPLHLLQQHTKELQAAHKAGASTTSSHGEALAQRQVEALQQQVTTECTMYAKGNADNILNRSLCCKLPFKKRGGTLTVRALHTPPRRLQ